MNWTAAAKTRYRGIAYRLHAIVDDSETGQEGFFNFKAAFYAAMGFWILGAIHCLGITLQTRLSVSRCSVSRKGIVSRAAAKAGAHTSELSFSACLGRYLQFIGVFGAAGGVGAALFSIIP